MRASMILGLFVAGTALGASPATAQETHLIVVGGVGGEDIYRAAFHEMAVKLIGAAEAGGLPAANITYLNERPERDPRIQGDSRREDVTAALERVASVAGATDQVFIVLIGHGSARGDEARFNLPGPDLSAAEFGVLLDNLDVARVVFVNTASASGGFVPTLAAPDRVVITATRTGNERNLTRFPVHFVDAYADPEASDTDKNGRVSVLEAFEYTRQEVARSYERDNQIATEHPLLDDDGDGEGAGEITADAADGRLARAAYLMPVQAALPADAANDPELQRLLREKADLEEQVQALRDLRDSMDPDAYAQQLEELLVELALKNREIREKGGGGS